MKTHFIALTLAVAFGFGDRSSAQSQPANSNFDNFIGLAVVGKVQGGRIQMMLIGRIARELFVFGTGETSLRTAAGETVFLRQNGQWQCLRSETTNFDLPMPQPDQGGPLPDLGVPLLDGKMYVCRSAMGSVSLPNLQTMR